MIIALKAFDDIGGEDWGYLIALYVFISLIRLAVVSSFHYLTCKLGYPIPWQNQVIVVWGGLRGAVGLALALLVASEGEIDFDKIGSKILFHTSGVVMLTLAVNATTISKILSWLKLDKITKAQEKMIDYAIDIIRDEHAKAIQVLKSDRVLCDAHWPLVEDGCYLISNHQLKLQRELEAKRLISRIRRGSLAIVAPLTKLPSANPEEEDVKRKSFAQQRQSWVEDSMSASLNGRGVGMRGSHFVMEDDKAIDADEVRLRFLKAEKRSLWKQFEEGLLGRDAVRLLVDEIDEVMDEPGKMIELQDLARFWEIPAFFERLSHYPLLKSFANYLVNTRLSLGYDIGIGFIIGQEEVEKLLDYMTDDEVVIKNIMDSSSETRLNVIKELSVLRKNYPEVAMSVKTHQSIRSVLNSGRRAITELHEDGVLDEAEAAKLIEMTELKMQHLISAPPTLAVPSPESVLRNIPWLRNCAPETVDALVTAAEQRVNEYSSHLVKIGEPSDGLYILISGLVKISAGPWRDYGGPGMILGELGVLMNTPRGADVVCQMVVRSVFLPKEIITQSMLTDSQLEYNLWKTAGVRIAYNKLVQMEPFNQWGTGRLRRFVEKRLVVEERARR